MLLFYAPTKKPLTAQRRFWGWACRGRGALALAGGRRHGARQVGHHAGIL